MGISRLSSSRFGIIQAYVDTYHGINILSVRWRAIPATNNVRVIFGEQKREFIK
jgi:hypothetical protein